MTLRIAEIKKSVPDTATLVSMYPYRFNSIGKFPGKFHIDVKPDIQPVINPPKKYPFHLKDKIQAELNKMTELDVIEPARK